MTKPKPPRLLDIEGGMAVAGTHDVQLALKLVVAGHDNFVLIDRQTPADAVAAELFMYLRLARLDWCRVLPEMRGFCMCGDGHAWDLYPAKPGSRGAFRVVDMTS